MRSDKVNSVIEDAGVLADQGHVGEAAEVVRRALRDAPKNSDLLLWLAVYSLDTPSDALALLRRCAQVSQTDPSRLTQCARLMMSLGSYADARDAAITAAKRIDDGFPLANELAHVLGRLADAEGNDARAEQFLTIAFEEDPDTLDHGVVLAEFLIARGRTADAYQIVVRALEQHPGDDKLLQLQATLERG